jgi:uncharacterized protein (DUF58 family)
LLAYIALAGAAMVGGLATGRVDIVVYACPFVVFVLVGLAVTTEPVITADVTVEPDRSLEGDPVDVTVHLRSRSGVPRVDAAVRLPNGTRAVEDAAVHVVRLRAEEDRRITAGVLADRWGPCPLGSVGLRLHDRTSMFVYEMVTPPATTVRFYPQPERLRRLARPRRTQLVAGDRVAKRSMGAGIELADLRMFVPGDRPRDVNWRVSARHGELWVTQRHPERSTDVVVFVDMFSDATLLPAVRAAATLIDAYLRTRDRVGLVGFGGVLQWVRPGQGLRQLYRLLDTLVDARTFFSYAWKDVGVIPPHVLPPGSLVVGISPLEDDRSKATLVDLRARGFEVAIIELSTADEIPTPTTEVDALALRLWHLQRAHQRDQLRRFGISIAQWRAAEPLGPTMEVLWDASETSGARPRG